MPLNVLAVERRLALINDVKLAAPRPKFLDGLVERPSRAPLGPVSSTTSCGGLNNAYLPMDSRTPLDIVLPWLPPLEGHFPDFGIPEVRGFQAAARATTPTSRKLPRSLLAISRATSSP